jgi:hypothetical protein
MAKPSITKRNTKGAALTYTELDDNFQNLKDATITLTAGTGGTAVSVDLNGTITLVAGSNITLTGNNSAKTITITSSGGGSSTDLNGLTDVTISSPTNGQYLIYNSTSGQWLNSTGNALTIDSGSGDYECFADIDLNGSVIRSNGSNIQVSDDVQFPSGTGPYVPGAGTLLVRGGTIKFNYSTDGALEFAGADYQTGAPSSTATPYGYLKVIIGGTTKWIPYYN